MWVVILQLHFLNDFSVHLSVLALTASESYDFQNFKFRSKCLGIVPCSMQKDIHFQIAEHTSGAAP